MSSLSKFDCPLLKECCLQSNAFNGTFVPIEIRWILWRVVCSRTTTTTWPKTSFENFQQTTTSPHRTEGVERKKAVFSLMTIEKSYQIWQIRRVPRCVALKNYRNENIRLERLIRTKTYHNSLTYGVNKSWANEWYEMYIFVFLNLPRNRSRAWLSNSDSTLGPW